MHIINTVKQQTNPLTGKDSITHMHGLVAHRSKGLLFTHDSYRGNCECSYLFSIGFTSFSVLFLFSLLPVSSLYRIFNTVSPEIRKIISINPSDKVLAFQYFQVHHSDRTGGPEELYSNSVISDNLNQIVNLISWICDFDFLSPALLYLFLTPEIVFCDHTRDLRWDGIFNLGPPTTASEFYE